MKRLTPDVRAAKIVKAAMRLYEIKNYHVVTMTEIAEEAGVSHSLVRHYFPHSQDIKDAAMSEAVTTQNCRILGQGLVDGNKILKRIPTVLKDRVCEFLKEL